MKMGISLDFYNQHKECIVSDFEIIIASDPDRDELIAELYYRGNQWVEISHETNEMLIEFYPHPSEGYWEFPLNEALNALEKAKQRMIALGPKHPTPLNARCLDIEKYQEYFKSGLLYNISTEGNSSSFTMESIFVNAKNLNNKIILSDQGTLRGKLILEEIGSATMNKETVALPKNQTFQRAIIQDCIIQADTFKLSLKIGDSPLAHFNICAKKIYWENFPTESLEEIKTDAWKKRPVC